MRALIPLVLLVGCSNYDPNLGNSPFKCAMNEPRCPDDYACMTNGEGVDVCVSDSGNGNDDGMTQPDGSNGFQCASDGTLEPNDAMTAAYNTMIMAGQPRTFGPLSICPAGDIDNYKIEIPSGSTKAIEVKVTWDSGTTLAAKLTNAGGAMIGAAATPAGSNAVRLCNPALSSGAYYAQVSAGDQVMNNYRITLSILDNCANP